MKQQAIHGKKIFIFFKGGVKILNCETMKWSIKKNSAYGKNKIEKILGLNNITRWKQNSTISTTLGS